MSSRWQSIRLVFLGTVSLSVFFLMLGTLLNPRWGKPQPFTFPSDVKLPGWQLKQKNALSIKNQHPAIMDRTPILGERYEYQYVNERKYLNLEIFVWEKTAGDINAILAIYRDSQPSPRSKFSKAEKRSNAQGSYLLYYDQSQVYLTSCINPRGGATTTSEQFIQNRKTLDVTPQRWLPIFLGIEDAQEWRCLWVQLSTPAPSSTQAGYAELELAWEDFSRLAPRYFPNFIK